MRAFRAVWWRWKVLTAWEQMWVIIWSPLLFVVIVGGLLVRSFGEALLTARWLLFREGEEHCD